MGFWRSTYFAYGLEVPAAGAPWQAAEHLEAELPKIKEQCPDVGFLQAGDHDQDMTFLVTKSEEIELGTYEVVRPDTVTDEQRADWDRQLIAACEALGFATGPDQKGPGWICVPDLS